MITILERIEESNPDQRPEHDDCDVIMSTLYDFERTARSGTSASEILWKKTGVPYTVIYKLAESDCMTILSETLRPPAAAVLPEDETEKSLLVLMGAFVIGFSRGITLVQNLDLPDISGDTTVEECIQGVIGEINMPSLEYAAKLTAIRMQLAVTLGARPEHETWPAMSQWLDGFIAGWPFVTGRTLRKML